MKRKLFIIIDQTEANEVGNTTENKNVKIRSFKIIVKEGEDYSGNKLRQINVNNYRTHVDCYDVMSGGETWTIKNNLVVENSETNASYTITKEKPVEKEESFDKMVADSLGSGKSDTMKAETLHSGINSGFRRKICLCSMEQ